MRLWKKTGDLKCVGGAPGRPKKLGDSECIKQALPRWSRHAWYLTVDVGG
jgi:hypothetical protein